MRQMVGKNVQGNRKNAVQGKMHRKKWPLSSKAKDSLIKNPKHSSMSLGVWVEVGVGGGRRCKEVGQVKKSITRTIATVTTRM